MGAAVLRKKITTEDHGEDYTEIITTGEIAAVDYELTGSRR
jgi:hypothetical protein